MATATVTEGAGTSGAPEAPHGEGDGAKTTAHSGAVEESVQKNGGEAGNDVGCNGVGGGGAKEEEEEETGVQLPRLHEALGLDEGCQVRFGVPCATLQNIAVQVIDTSRHMVHLCVRQGGGEYKVPMLENPNRDEKQLCLEDALRLFSILGKVLENPGADVPEFATGVERAAVAALLQKGREAKIGLLLQFKDAASVMPSLRLLEKIQPAFTGPVILHAEVFIGPNSKMCPVFLLDPDRFVQECQAVAPTRLIGLGWNCDRISPSGKNVYLSTSIHEMWALVEKYKIRNALISLRAAYIQDSWPNLLPFFKANPLFGYLISNLPLADEIADASLVLWLKGHFPIHQLYLSFTLASTANVHTPAVSRAHIVPLPPSLANRPPNAKKVVDKSSAAEKAANLLFRGVKKTEEEEMVVGVMNEGTALGLHNGGWCVSRKQYPTEGRKFLKIAGKVRFTQKMLLEKNVKKVDLNDLFNDPYEYVAAVDYNIHQTFSIFLRCPGTEMPFNAISGNPHHGIQLAISSDGKASIEAFNIYKAPLSGTKISLGEKVPIKKDTCVEFEITDHGPFRPVEFRIWPEGDPRVSTLRLEIPRNRHPRTWFDYIIFQSVQPPQTNPEAKGLGWTTVMDLSLSYSEKSEPETVKSDGTDESANYILQKAKPESPRRC